MHHDVRRIEHRHNAEQCKSEEFLLEEEHSRDEKKIHVDRWLLTFFDKMFFGGPAMIRALS